MKYIVKHQFRKLAARNWHVECTCRCTSQSRAAEGIKSRSLLRNLFPKLALGFIPVIPLLISVVFLASCSTMPVINAPKVLATPNNLTCPSPFLKGKYQLMHAIEITAAGIAQGVIIGVTVVDPFASFVSCAIITAEGMVLLEAESSGEKLTVHRALPPFDSGDFAKNLIDDIRLIYFAPQGLLQKKGNLTDGSTVCRWQDENGNFIDLIAGKPESAEIKRYSACGILKRHVKLTQKAGIPCSIIELQGSEMVDYTLLMTLIDAHTFESKSGKINKGKKQ